jgi:hypothetical protein
MRAALLVLLLAGCASARWEGEGPTFAPGEEPVKKPEFVPEPRKPKKERDPVAAPPAKKESGALDGRFTGFLWAPRYDGRSIVTDRERGSHRGRPRGTGYGLRGDWFRDRWRLELATSKANFSDDFGIEDRSHGHLIDEDVDHSFQTLSLGGGPCLWQTSWKAGAEKYQGTEGARVDLLGGLWVERHETVQAGFANWPVATDSETDGMAFVGLRAEWSPDRDVRVHVRGDVAGFAHGRRQVWRVEGAVGFRLGKRAWVAGGWIFEDIDLRRGDPARYRVDTHLGGPFLSVEFDL